MTLELNTRRIMANFPLGEETAMDLRSCTMFRQRLRAGGDILRVIWRNTNRKSQLSDRVTAALTDGINWESNARNNPYINHTGEQQMMYYIPMAPPTIGLLQQSNIHGFPTFRAR